MITVTRRKPVQTIAGRKMVVRLVYLNDRGGVSLEGWLRGTVTAGDGRGGANLALEGGDCVRLPADLTISDATLLAENGHEPLLEACWTIVAPQAAPSAFWHRFGRRASDRGTVGIPAGGASTGRIVPWLKSDRRR